MRMLTHVVFGAGLATVLSTVAPFYPRLNIAVIVSILANPAIDLLGHMRKGSHISRSPLTHSLLTAPLWSAVMGLLSWELLLRAGAEQDVPVLSFVVAGVVVAGAHLFLDSLTERGIFIVDRRFALAHFRSSNGILNGVFLALGLALLFYYAETAVPV